VRITTNQPDTKSNPNPNSKPTTKQLAIVSIRLNILKFIRIKAEEYTQKIQTDE